MRRILLAVSGGIDSMYMANRASELFPEASFAIAHCNFSLREDADGDEAFVRGWAEKHSIPFHTKKFDTKEYADAEGISIEMAARQLRYDWFAQLCSEYGYEAVAVAHNKNDNAETMMLNLLRGTGIRGMMGMSADNGTVLRPLLSTGRDEIRSWMEAHGETWREDCTNSESVYKRNRIRNEVFPIFGRINPSFLDTLNSDIQHFRQVGDIADAYFESSGLDRDSIDIVALKGMKHWEYLLYRLTEGRLNQQELDSLTECLKSGRNVGGKRFGNMVVSGGRLVQAATCTADALCTVVEGPGTYNFKGLRIRVELLDRDNIGNLKQPKGILVADASALKFPFLLRGWREGDYMRPLGLKGRKKLSDLFVDLKWGQPEKAGAVVAVSPALDDKEDGHVAALLCERIDDAIKIKKGSTSALRISIL